jgi:quinol monooxygenase YgiN
MTIIIRTIMNVLPEKQKEVVQTLLSLIEPSEYEGCLSYAILGDIENTQVINLISEWQNRRQLDRHLSSDRFGVLLGTRSLLCEPLDIQIITVADVEGMETVNALRKKETIQCKFRREGG